VADWLAALGGIIAAVAAVIAIVLSVRTAQRQRELEQKSYLVLGLELGEPQNGKLIARTSVENRSREVKKLSTVFLLACPYDEAPVDAFNTVLQAHEVPPVTDISQFGAATRGLDPRCSHGDRSYARLDYYTLENSEVGDELLTYDAVLDISALRPDHVYSVRLFLYGEQRLHRVVHRAVVTGPRPFRWIPRAG
jgi:hypothetical protein